MKMTIRIGSRDGGYYVVPPGSHMTVEVNGKEADLGPAEGVVELLRWYSSQPSPDATTEIHDRLAVAEASAEGLKSALREAQARCESLVKEHAKYREGVIAGDKMVPDKRAALEKRIAELEEVIANKEKRIDTLKSMVEEHDSQTQGGSLEARRLKLQLAEAEKRVEGLHQELRDVVEQNYTMNENLIRREGDIALLKERLKLLETCKEAVEIADRRRGIVEACRVRGNALEAFVASPANADQFVAGLEAEKSIEERIARIERAIPWLGGAK